VDESELERLLAEFGIEDAGADYGDDQLLPTPEDLEGWE
jgi:hypothetical protein